MGKTSQALEFAARVSASGRGFGIQGLVFFFFLLVLGFRVFDGFRFFGFGF